MHRPSDEEMAASSTFSIACRREPGYPSFAERRMEGLSDA